MEKVQKYIDEHKQQFLDELFDLLRSMQDTSCATPSSYIPS